MNIDIDSDQPLENAVFTRLFGIDAPELAPSYYVKTDDLQHAYPKRMGPLSLHAVHLCLHMFVLFGTALNCVKKFQWRECTSLVITMAVH